MNKWNKKLDHQGFTLIELLMVVMLIGILAAIGITQFTNFSVEAKNGATRANLQTLRRGIAVQNAQMRLRCGVVSNAWPPRTNLVANDITTSACTTTQVPNAQDRAFVNGSIPPNPWGYDPTDNTIAACETGQTCDAATLTKTLNCTDHLAFTTANSIGWCYDALTGHIWANSRRNAGALVTGTEIDF